MLANTLQNALICNLEDLLHLKQQGNDCNCELCRRKDRTLCFMGFVLDVRCKLVRTQRQEHTNLLEITFLEESELLVFNIWGQLAEDRLKFNLKEGAVCLVASATISRDRYFRPILHGDLIAYTPISNDSELEWLVLSLGALMSNEFNAFQSKCTQIIAKSNQKPDLRTLRDYWQVSVNKRTLVEMSKVRRACLFTIRGSLLPLTASIAEEYVEVDFEDEEGARTKLFTSHALLVEQLAAELHRPRRSCRDGVGVLLTGVAVGYAYYKSIKRLVAGEHSKVTFNEEVDSLPLSLSLSSSFAPPPLPPLFPDVDSIEEALEYVSWGEFWRQMQSNELCTEEREARRLVFCSLQGLSLPSSANIADNLIIEHIVPPSYSFRSQHDRPHCTHVAYRSVMFAFGPPFLSFPLYEVTSQLVNLLEPNMEADREEKKILWHEEIVHALLRYGQSVGGMTQVSPALDSGAPATGEQLLAMADDRALTSIFDQISAEDLAHSLKNGHEQDTDNGCNMRYTKLLQGLSEAARVQADMLVIFKCSVTSSSQECFTSSLSVFVEHIY